MGQQESDYEDLDKAEALATEGQLKRKKSAASEGTRLCYLQMCLTLCVGYCLLYLAKYASISGLSSNPILSKISSKSA